jgi:hypothetical protein
VGAVRQGSSGGSSSSSSSSDTVITDSISSLTFVREAVASLLLLRLLSLPMSLLFLWQYWYRIPSCCTDRMLAAVAAHIGGVSIAVVLR